MEPVGPSFFAYARRKRHNRTFSEDERHQAEERAKLVVEEEQVDFEYEDVDPSTVNTDPTNWKVKILHTLVSDRQNNQHFFCSLKITMPFLV